MRAERKRGLFFTLEGGEGSGKTTAINYLEFFLKKMGHECVMTREPGGTKIGEQIRSILLNPEHKGMNYRTELLLYMADRAVHLDTVIRPALDSGKIVLCDRYTDSNIIYQGYMRELGVNLVIVLHRILGLSLRPDITFLLDLPAEVGLARAWKQFEKNERGKKESRFEQEILECHKKIREGYLKLAMKEPSRWVIVDVLKNNEKQTADIICNEIQKRFL